VLPLPALAAISPLATLRMAASRLATALGLVAARFSPIGHTFPVRRCALAPAAHLLVALGHRGSARKAHPSLFVNSKALDPDFVAHFDDVLGLLDAEVSQFADMHQAVFTGQKFNERSKILDRNDLAAINLAYLCFGGHSHDCLARNLHSFLGHRVNVDGAVVFDIDFAARFFDQLLERIRPLAGVESVGLASTIPLRDDSDGPEPIEVRGAKDVANAEARTRPPVVRIVTPDYFRTLGASILAGRDFNQNDSNKEQPVVVVNQHLANRYWPDGSAVGRQIGFSPNKWLPIVGVVSDIRNHGLDQEPVDEVYGSLAESPQGAMNVVIRSSRITPELGQQLKWIAHDIDPNAVVADMRPMIDVRKEWLASRRTTAMFLTIFAVIAMCITASGISGMMALTVGERKHEIGVRLALGATPGSVILSMMKQVLSLMILGLGAGFCAAWMMSTSMSHIISGIAPRDLMTYAVSSALLIAVTAASALIPLSRIAKLDPVMLLRAE